jgi:hypothetical protein
MTRRFWRNVLLPHSDQRNADHKPAHIGDALGVGEHRKGMRLKIDSFNGVRVEHVGSLLPIASSD